MNQKHAEERFRQLCRIFPERMQRALHNLNAKTRDTLQEIRLRGGRPVQLCASGRIVFLDIHGELSDLPHRDCLAATADDIQEVFRAGCGYSIHSHQNQIAQGFVQLAGGHRMGVCGTAVVTDGKVAGIRELSSLNIRVAHELPGCADALVPYTDCGRRGLLLAGPPSSGKTTLLRDLARQLGTGTQGPVRKVALMDERGELAASWQGEAQNDVGVCTDILTGFEKAAAIQIAVRTLSPDLIVCDEIGADEDIRALKTGATCGVQLIASVHAATMREALQKPFVRQLHRLGAFHTIVLLGGQREVGQIKQVYTWEDDHVKSNRIRADSDLQLSSGAERGAKADPADPAAGGGHPADRAARK